MSARTMYMHTLDGQPATYSDGYDSPYLWYASKGHRRPAARLVPSLGQIHREQQRCIAEEWRHWNALAPEHRGERPSIKRYDYVLVEVPA